MHNKNDRCSILPAVLSGLTALAAAGAVSSSHAQTATTSFKIGGYIKLDAMSSAYSDGDPTGGVLFGRDFYLPSGVPVGSAPDEGRDTDFHARSSRINFQTTTDVNGEKVVGFFEIDFMTGLEGDARTTNSYQPRLRHAYFTYGKWLFGQTWSTFQNVGALPEVLDFIGPTEGTVFVRQAQVRYTNGPWQFALENPESTVTPFGGGDRITTDDHIAPDLVARYSFKSDTSTIDVAALLRSLSYENVPAQIDDSVFGYGLSVSGKINLGARDDLRFMVTHGSGLGRYIGVNVVNGAVLDEDNDLELIDLTSAMVSYRHFWTEQWRSTLSLGYLTADHDTALTGNDVTKQVQSLHLNLLYSPVPKVTVGAEIILAERELENGESGKLDRLQFSAKYEF